MSGDFTMLISLEIPVAEMCCKGCGAKQPETGEEFDVVIRYGSAWKDGYAQLTDGAELFTAEIYCARCKPPSEAVSA